MESQITIDKRNHLYAFVALKHFCQKRKYTNGSYLSEHLLPVAKMAEGKCKLGYEIGLCHDLLEDTNCSIEELLNALIRFGYEEVAAYLIVASVIDLTDYHTTENYPHLNRKIRKASEAERMKYISPDSQT